MFPRWAQYDTKIHSIVSFHSLILNGISGRRPSSRRNIQMMAIWSQVKLRLIQRRVADDKRWSVLWKWVNAAVINAYLKYIVDGISVLTHMNQVLPHKNSHKQKKKFNLIFLNFFDQNKVRFSTQIFKNFEVLPHN